MIVYRWLKPPALWPNPFGIYTVSGFVYRAAASSNYRAYADYRGRI